MNELLARNLPRLRKVAGQFTVMTFGSGLFFLIKIGCLYLTEQIGLAAWLSYLVINVVLTIIAWTYHSKVTFKTGMSTHTAWRYIHATLGFMLFDYLGFLALTYAGHFFPVVSAILMGVMQLGSGISPTPPMSFASARRTHCKALGLATSSSELRCWWDRSTTRSRSTTHSPKDGKQNYCAAANLYVFGVLSNCEGEAEAGAKPNRP